MKSVQAVAELTSNRNAACKQARTNIYSPARIPLDFIKKSFKLIKNLGDHGEGAS